MPVSQIPALSAASFVVGHSHSAAGAGIFRLVQLRANRYRWDVALIISRRANKPVVVHRIRSVACAGGCIAVGHSRNQSRGNVLKSRFW